MMDGDFVHKAPNAVVAAMLLLLTGCGANSGAAPPSAAGTSVSEAAGQQYGRDIEETAALVAEYVRAWEKSGSWPKPDSFRAMSLIYKGTEASSPTFPGRRRDFYRTTFDGGRELDIVMYGDGRIEVKVIWDREPSGPAP